MQKFQIWPDVYCHYCFLVMQKCFQCRFHLQSVSVFKVIFLVFMAICVFNVILVIMAMAILCGILLLGEFSQMRILIKKH